MSVKRKAEILEGENAAEEKALRIHGAPKYPRCPVCNGRQTNKLIRSTCQWCGASIFKEKSNEQL